jgi:hypothetical protein
MYIVPAAEATVARHALFGDRERGYSDLIQLHFSFLFEDLEHVRPSAQKDRVTGVEGIERILLPEVGHLLRRYTVFYQRPFYA